MGGIWATQQLHNAAVHALALHPATRRKTDHALVAISNTTSSKAVLMRKAAGAWEIERIYTADHFIPGTVGVLVLGVW